MPPEFTFDPETHVFRRPDGTQILSITQVLQRIGVVDYGRAKPDVLKRAQEKGRAVHMATQLLDEARLNRATLDPELVPYLQGYESFKAKTGFKPRLIEQPMVHPLWPFGGIPDREGTVPSGQAWVLEIKSTEIEPWVGLQLAAQELLIASQEKVVGGSALAAGDRKRFAVALRPDATFDLVPFKEKSDHNVFLGGLAVAQWKRIHLN